MEGPYGGNQLREGCDILHYESIAHNSHSTQPPAVATAGALLRPVSSWLKLWLWRWLLLRTTTPFVVESLMLQIWLC